MVCVLMERVASEEAAEARSSLLIAMVEGTMTIQTLGRGATLLIALVAARDHETLKMIRKMELVKNQLQLRDAAEVDLVAVVSPLRLEISQVQTTVEVPEGTGKRVVDKKMVRMVARAAEDLPSKSNRKEMIVVTSLKGEVTAKGATLTTKAAARGLTLHHIKEVAKISKLAEDTHLRVTKIAPKTTTLKIVETKQKGDATHALAATVKTVVETAAKAVTMVAITTRRNSSCKQRNIHLPYQRKMVIYLRKSKASVTIRKIGGVMTLLNARKLEVTGVENVVVTVAETEVVTAVETEVETVAETAVVITSPRTETSSRS
jgi:hypothetical protein